MISTSGNGGCEGGGGGMAPTGGLGPPPPFLFFLEAPELFFFKTDGDFWFVVSHKAWHHFTICDNVQIVPQSILEDIVMALV